jgi:hypothetical protein
MSGYEQLGREAAVHAAVHGVPQRVSGVRTAHHGGIVAPEETIG